MKKKLLTLLFAMVAIAASAFDYGDFRYTVQADGTATIFGFKSGYTGSPTSITIPGYCFDSSTQKYYKVKTIGPRAFTGKTSIQRVTIQYGVEDIHEYAFNGCTSLNTVDLPSSIKNLANGVFYNAPIININCAAETMPTLTSNAFQGLGTVSGTRYWTCATPDGMTAANAVSLITSNFTVQRSPTAADFHSHVMGSSSTNNLYDVYLNVTQGWDPATQTYGKLKLLGADARSSATNKTLKIGINQSYSQGLGNFYVTRIDKSMRYRCSTIETLDMSSTNKIDSIDTQAFYGSTALTKAIVSAKVIGSFAFYNCKNLTTLQLYGSSESSQGVQELYNQCFAYTGVTSVYIPSSLTTYGSAFAFCSSLTKFTVSSSNNYFADDANSPNCLYNKSKTTLYQMGGGTTPANMVDLSSSLPNTLIYIGIRALAGAKLSIVDIPYGVKSIDQYAFSGMPNVQTIRIPSSVTSVGSSAFSGLSTTTLKHIYMNLKTIPSGFQSTSVFSSLPSGVTLHVPLWRTNYYTTGSWWSGWSSKFTGGVVEDSYDFTYGKVATGTYIDYILYYTVNSASPYTDTYVQSAAADGQLTVVRAYLGSTGNFNGTITFRDTETHRGKTYIVTEVQREVFHDQTAITRVTGGKGIKKIGALAFAGLTGCSNGFNIPNPIEFGDSSLFRCSTPNITLGNRLTTIGNDAFRSTAVKQVIMPNSVTKIGSRFLAGSTQLDSLRLSPNITEIPATGLAWVNCRYIIIPYGVKKIGAQAFMSDEFGAGLSEPVHENIVVIPSSVTTIASDAFKYARHLDAIFLNVPYGVFSSTRADWCRRVKTDADNAYDWDGHLLFVPQEYLADYQSQDAGIRAVFQEQIWVRAGAFDFYRGTDLWTTPYRMTVTNATNMTAKYVVNGNARVTSGSSIDFRTTETNSAIGKTYTMTEIGPNCMDATIYYSSNGQEHQGENFINVNLPSTITRIGDYAFRGCSGLKTEVNVPESVSYIGQYAFNGCTQLPSIFLNRTGTTTIGTQCWNATPTSAVDPIRLYVPLAQMHNIAWQTRSWLPNTWELRRLLPYIKPTHEWEVISVPVDDGIRLPATGEFYAAAMLDKPALTIYKDKLINDYAYAGYTGMLFKGTVGTVYRFRQISDYGNYDINTPRYNILTGIRPLSASTDYGYIYYGDYYFNETTQKFTKNTNQSAAMQLAVGKAYLDTDDIGNDMAGYISIGRDFIYYPLTINKVSVNDINAGDLSVIDGVSGTVKYDIPTSTLTLQNATITQSEYIVRIISNDGVENLTIKLVGTNKVSSERENTAINLDKSTTITGTGSLLVESEYVGCWLASGSSPYNTLSITGGAQVTFNGEEYGLYSGGGNLVVTGTNTKLTAKNTKTTSTYCSIYQITPNLGSGFTVTEPAGAYFNNVGTVVDASGNPVRNQNVVISKVETAYDLWINGTQVTSENAGNLSVIDGVSGTVTYNATTNTLTLQDANLTTDQAVNNIRNEIEGLKVNVVGTNTLAVTSGASNSIHAEKPMTITGSGTLTAGATGGAGCYTKETLTIQDGVQANFTGAYGINCYGFSSTTKLVVSGAQTRVTANGTSASMQYTRATLNDGLAITQPAGATFNSNGTVVDASGNTISRQDVVISMPVSRGFKYMGLWYEEISGTSGVTLIAPQGVTTYSGNVVIPPAFNYMGTVYEVRAIEANAFTGTAVTSVEVPSTVKTIGDGAFYGATSLSTLIFATEDMPNKLTLGEEFVGNNASDFKFYVCNPCLPAWTVRYDYNFLPWVKTEDNGFLSFASSQGVTLPEGLTAYRVTGYNSGSRMATTTRLTSSAIPERTGLVLKGQPATRYLLQAASSAPAVGDNMLLPLIGIEDIPYAPYATNPDDSKIYFLGGSCVQWNVFANSVDLFMVLRTGQAYLAVDKSLLGGDYTSPVQLDLWSAVPGDVNGDGTVDVTDVNILVNIILGKANAADYPNANINGEGGIDVSDVNAVVNIILGKV